MLCPVAQGCCGLLLWQDIREGLVFMDIKNYPISHPRKSFRPGNITSGLLLHHTAFIPQYCYAGPTESKEKNTLYRQPSDSDYPSVPDLRVGLRGTDVAFLPQGRHTLHLFTLHRKEIIQPVGVHENHIAGLNGLHSLKEKHKGPKNLSKTRQDMRVYSPNPPISEVEGGSFISLDCLSVVHLVREKRRSCINYLGALSRQTQRLMQGQFNKTRTVPCHRHVIAASWTAPYQVLPCH